MPPRKKIAAATAAAATSPGLSQEEEIGVAPISLSKQSKIASITPQIPVEEVKTKQNDAKSVPSSLFGDMTAASTFTKPEVPSDVHTIKTTTKQINNTLKRWKINHFILIY